MNEDRAASLKAEFDESFRREVETGQEGDESLLLLRLEDGLYGLKMSDIKGIVRDKAITDLPGSPPELLGIAGFRGVLVAVYSLAALLREPPGETSWMVLLQAAGDTRVALAFAGLEAQIRVGPEAFVELKEGGPFDRLVRWGRGTVPVLCVDALLDDLLRRLGAGGEA
jgi:purine-binding chemotaxis protein CheW